MSSLCILWLHDIFTKHPKHLKYIQAQSIGGAKDEISLNKINLSINNSFSSENVIRTINHIVPHCNIQPYKL